MCMARSKIKPFVVMILIAMTVLSGCGGTSSPQPTATSIPPTTTATMIPPTPTPESSSGIISMTRVGSGASLHVTDPISGTYHEFVTFSPRDSDVFLDPTITNFIGSSAIVLRSLFSPDYTLAVASKFASDGSFHVGWIDRDGDFTDVTALMPPRSDFSSTVKTDTPMFGVDGSFYFASRIESTSGSKNKPTVMKTTIENPSQIVVAPNQVGVSGNDVNYWVQSHGTVIGLCPACTASLENVKVGEGGYRAQDWINDTDWVQLKYDRSMIYRDNIDQFSSRDPAHSPYGTKLIPETNREVWSPVVSPDGTQIAFLSSSGGTTELFVVSSTGGQPTRVPLSTQGPSSSSNLLDWI